MVATQLINLLPDTRIPKIVLHLIIESGAAIGDIILMNDCGSGVAFTGPTDTAAHINVELSKPESAIALLIAEIDGKKVRCRK